MRLTRRGFAKGAGAALVAAWSSPVLTRLARAGTLDPAPFEFGVASADPRPDGALLWTRVGDPSVDRVRWEVAIADDALVPDFDPRKIVARGTAPVRAAADGTVELHLSGLPEPGRHYWYRFETREGRRSVPGRTKTTPEEPSRIRFAVCSCQDYAVGLYHAWADVAVQDLDFVLFLGDYVYETPDDPDALRRVRPAGEVFTLAGYHERYRTYRSDPDLREAHRLHPFISVWDDHEVVNDRWSAPTPGGSPDHDPAAEGAYAEREAAGHRAYLEWVPTTRPDPGDPRRIYRSFDLGPLAELVVIDTRAYRNAPVGARRQDLNPVKNLDPALSDDDRTMLGAAQKAWLKERLRRSTARWKLVGNQVPIGHLNLAALPDAAARIAAEVTGEGPFKVHRDGIPVLSDQWDGYQAERRELLEFLRNPEGDVGPAGEVTGHPDGIPDVVFLTGDAHTSWAQEVPVDPGDYPADAPVAVELVGTSITSINANEAIGQMTIGRPLPHGTTDPAKAAVFAVNRHLRYAELDSNGYYVVDVDTERLRVDYRFVTNPAGDVTSNPVENPSAVVAPAPGGSWLVPSGTSRLVPASRAPEVRRSG